MIKLKIIGTVLCLLLCVTGCSKPKANNNNQNTSMPQNENTASEQSAVEANINGMDFSFTERDKNDTYDKIAAKQIVLSSNITNLPSGVTLNDNQIIISKADTYLVSGTAENITLTVQVPSTEKL